MRSSRSRSLWIALALAAVALMAAAGDAAAAAPPVPAGGLTLEHVSLDWSGDEAMQGPNYGNPNFFSAGVSKGTEATYAGSEDDVSILLEKEGNAVATWATHLNYGVGAGEHQVVHLSEGTGHLNADGSAEVAWTGAFTVDYYSTLVPFAVEEPRLVINAEGTGALIGTLSGCKGSRTEPGVCPAVPTVPDAEVATFSGVEVNPLGEITIEPEYEGVEVETGTASAQNRTEAGWGAWPQSFVNFQLETGLSSFFYSSGLSSDPEKVPYDFSVDFGVESLPVEHASLDWTGNDLIQSVMYGTFHNYLSAGDSDGTEAGYKGAEGNAEIYLEGSKSIATWATHANYGSEAGQQQVAHLTNGVGQLNADGSAEITWDASFSVNFYEGLEPFTIENPTLVVEPDGSGELTATLVGCESSMSSSSECTPFAPATEVQVATFSGADVNPNADLTVDPDYSEVVVTTTAAPQVTSGPDWGSWPQSFVDFQNQTGLSSYWYSSGSEDSSKVPLPFLVDYTGRELAIAKEETVTPPSEGGGSETKTAPSVTTPAATVTKPAKVTIRKGTVKVGTAAVKVATLTCPAGGTACKTVVPTRVSTKIGGKRFVLTVSAPKQIAPGKSAAIKVRLPKAAVNALGAKKVTVKIRVGLVANGLTTKHLIKVKIVGKK